MARNSRTKRFGTTTRVLAAVAMAALVAGAPATAAQPTNADQNEGYEGLVNAFRAVVANDDRVDRDVKEAFDVPLAEPGQRFASFTGQPAVYEPTFDIDVASGTATVFNPHGHVVSGDLNGDGSPDSGSPLLVHPGGAIGPADENSAANLLLDSGWIPSADGTTWEVRVNPSVTGSDGTPVQDNDALFQHALALPDATRNGDLLQVPADILLPEVVVDLATGNLIPPSFPNNPVVLPGDATPADFMREVWTRGGGTVTPQNGITLLGDDGTFLYEEGTAPLGPSPLVFIGVDLEGELDLLGGGVGDNLNIDFVDDRGTQTPFSALPQFENDYGDGTTNIKAFMYTPQNGPQALYDLPFNGSFFEPFPANSTFLAGPGGAGHVFGAQELMGASGFDLVIFVTDPSNPVQPETVAKSNLRGRPSINPLVPLAQITPLITVPDGPGAQMPVGRFFTENAFSNGTCPQFPESYIQTNDILIFGGDDGVFHLHQLDENGQVTRGMWPGSGPIVLDGINQGHVERFEFDPGDAPTGSMAGTYTFQETLTSEPCTWDTNRLSVELFSETLVSLAPAAQADPTPEPTTEPATEPTAEPTASTDDGAEPTAEPTATTAGTGDGESDDGDGGFPTVLAIIGLLAGLGLLGWGAWTFFNGGAAGACADELAAWLHARRACAEARKAEAAAQDELIDKQADLTRAERELKEHCSAYPPACGPEASASSDGRTLTRDDLHVQRAWARATWSRYRSGDASAQQTSDAWSRGPDEAFTQATRAALDAAKAKTPALEAAQTAARQARDTAKAAAEAAADAAAEACAAETAAREAYERCIGAAIGAGGAAAAAGGATAGTPGTPGAQPGGGGPAHVADESQPSKDCEPERQAAASARAACSAAQAAEQAARTALHAAIAETNRIGGQLAALLAANPFVADPEFDDSWIQRAGDPASRVTSADLWTNQRWSEAVWEQYQGDQLTAEQLEQRWRDGPPQGWSEAALGALGQDRARYAQLRAQLDAARTRQAELQDAHRATAEAAAEACAAAEAADRAYLACIGARIADAGARAFAGATEVASGVSGNTAFGSFLDEAGLDIETAPIDYREGDEITTVRKLNGLNKYANVTLKWGINDSVDLADWHNLIGGD